MFNIKKLGAYARSLPKSMYFNLKYFPFSKAIRLPILISHRVWLMKTAGNIILPECKTERIKIGFGEVGIFDKHRSRSIWQVSGTVEFKGKAKIGHGSKISVSGKLIIGSGFCMTAESSIVAQKEISFGNNVLVSWDALIMDTDFHDIFDEKGQLLNAPMPIRIGDNVWIGCRTLILKGIHIADGVVVAAASTITKTIDESNAIIAGSPATVVKEKISWKP